jgi:hypothetical protein
MLKVIAAAALMTGVAIAQTPPAPKVALMGVNEQRTKKVDKGFFSGFEGLTLRFQLSGPAVKDAVRVGNLKVEAARDNLGTDLIIAESTFNATNQPDFTEIGRFERRDDKMERDVRLKVPPRGAAKVAVKGSIDLIVGGADADVDFAAVKLREERTLEHADLTAAGFKVRIVKAVFGGGDKQLSCVFEGDDRMFREMALVDSAGKVTKLEGRGWYRSGSGPRIRSFGGSGALPAEAVLRIIVRKGAVSVTVPFSFESVELP